MQYLKGIIIEARQEVGRGATATVIVQKGTLKVGDAIHCGEVYCKVKAMIDDQGNQVKKAPPSVPQSIFLDGQVFQSRCSIKNFLRMKEKPAVKQKNIYNQ